MLSRCKIFETPPDGEDSWRGLRSRGSNPTGLWFTVMGKLMTDNLAGKREIIGGYSALRTAVWTGLLGAAVFLNTVAVAGQSDDKSERFLRPQLGRIPMWANVDPGKAEIFEKPTPADPGDEIRCLALNIYFEARGESETGRLAVGHVVMNRVLSVRFPETVCDVVRQGGELRRYRCQFSWWCDGRSDKPLDKREWRKSAELALAVYWGRTEDPTAGALWYHADYVNPSWRHDFVRGPKIGRHIFYSRVMSKTQVASRSSSE